jgi:hypothetical protein
MAEMTKMKIKSNGGEFELKINPEAIKFDKQIKYQSVNLIGSAADVVKYDAHASSTLSFDFVLDSTGVAYEKKESLDKAIETFEKVAYLMDGQDHQPNILTVSWGTFVFKCYLTSLSYNYTLFSPSGEPLRVKISVSFAERFTIEEAEKMANKRSPDMTHVVTLKAGETIVAWCYKIYGDASYCADVALYNNLTGFRNMKAGTQVVFPPLQR